MPHLTKLNIDQLLAGHPPRTNFNLFWVDGAYTMRVARVRGEYPWHRHHEHDEAWLVLRGKVQIRSDQGAVELSAGEALLIPRGLRHSPVAVEDLSTVLIVNSRDFATNYEDGITHQDVGYREFEAPVQPPDAPD